MNFNDNSGLWLDNKIETTENQKKCMIPYNPIAQLLSYNQRMIISAPVDEGVEPTAWRISKVENNNPVGILYLTFAQDKYNQHTDYIERDESGYVIGMWADYYKDIINDTTDSPDSNGIYNKITFNGTKAQIKVNGSYRTLTANYYNSNNELLSGYIGQWTFYIDDVYLEPEVRKKNLEIVTYREDSGLAECQIKIKFIGAESYAGKTLRIHNFLNDIKTDCTLKITL